MIFYSLVIVIVSKLIKNNSKINSKSIKHIKRINNKVIMIAFHEKNFGGNEVRVLLEALNYILIKWRFTEAIYIEFKQFKPRDKLSYIIFEAIILEVIQFYKKTVYINLGNVVSQIHTDGLNRSLLVSFANNEFNHSQYIKEYRKTNRLNNNSFRRIVYCDVGNSVSELMTDIKTFLRYSFQFDKEDINKIARLVSELADNACEHGKSDCIIDVDISDTHYKKNDEESEYYAINICALNFSSVLLGNELKNKLSNDNLPINTRYCQIKDAYDYHQKFFDERYTEEHFFSLASMQNSISGRENEYETGGKGLTEIVKELELNSMEHECYVLFGNKVISFKPEFLDIDNDNFIAFNKDKDFLHSKPCDSAIGFSDTYLEGTGYNLTLVYKKEKNYGK